MSEPNKLTTHGQFNVPKKLVEETNKLEPSAVIELWEVDMTAFGREDKLYLCNQTNEKGQGIVWKGQVYQPYPIKAEGFKSAVEGAQNRPNITVANLGGLVTTAVHGNYLVGAKVARRVTYGRFLDSVNFINGNREADPLQEAVQWFIIERISALNADVASFELAIPIEVEGAKLPRRIILADVCPWVYRSEECGYEGGPCADRFGKKVTTLGEDDCGHKIPDCELRFGKDAILPFGGFLSVDRIAR